MADADESHDEDDDEELETSDAEEVDRARGSNIAKLAKVRKQLIDLYHDVKKGFTDQKERADDQQDYWDIYNNKLGQNQFYSGNSQIFAPIVYNAINARKTRFINQIFPMSGRCVEVVSEDGTIPHRIVALLEHYVTKTRLRQLAHSMFLNADVEGQFNLYVDWSSRERHVVQRVKKPAQAGRDLMGPPEDDIEDVEEKIVKSDHPAIEVLADCDVLILPATAAGPEDAIAQGGSVTVVRRWGKSRLKKLIKEKQIDRKIGEELIKELSKDARDQQPDKDKAMAEAAGIKSSGKGKYCIIYETWSNVDTPEGWRLCRTYFAGEEKIPSCVRNPFWSDRLPIISEPLNRIQGSAKGISSVAAVADMQYFANDTINEAADSAAFSLLPIIMTDPAKNPRVGSMVLNLAAVWETSPNDTKFAEFPELWKQGLELVASIQQTIFQTLSVNPSQITQATKKKQSQAEVANEQQVDILTTADVVSIVEERVLTPLIQRFAELDHQFRDETIRVREYGEVGMQQRMQDIDPIQMGTRYVFRWFGVEQVRSVQQIQQQIAMMNILKTVPPQMYQGYKMNLAPLIVFMCEAAFGPRIAPLVFEDVRSQLSVDPEQENQLLAQGHDVPPHPLDNHQQHIAAHMKFAKETGDPNGLVKAHIIQHVQLLGQAAAAQQQATQPQPGAPPHPGGGAPGGAGGGPRQGAQPRPMRPGGQQPPGAIHQDQMQDPRVMPRRMGS